MTAQSADDRGKITEKNSLTRHREESRLWRDDVAISGPEIASTTLYAASRNDGLGPQYSFEGL